MDLSLPIFILIGSIVLYTILYYRSSKSPARFPPGPPPEFLLWNLNLRHLPRTNAWKTYSQWSKSYKINVVSFSALGKRIIVINSTHAATDLLDKRGNIYSERAHNVMLQDLRGIGDETMVFIRYNDKFRLHRKVINTALDHTSVRDYFPLQEKETAAGSTILTTTYGHQVTSDDDYLVKLSEKMVSYTRQAIPPTSFLVNILPSLKYIPDWVPGIPFKRFAKTGPKLKNELFELPWKEVKKQLAEGTAAPSYTTRLPEAKGTITGEHDEESIIKHTAAIMYGAGADTSTTALATFILALVLHPEVQKKAQVEIDTVVGNNRLPTFADQGIPHAIQRDDVYNGMYIPAGSAIITNIWPMLQDESIYPEPSKFWPERFDGRFPNIRPPRTITFGFNRRLCPGRHLALNGLFIQAANLLAVYNFTKACDESGNEIEPAIDYSRGPPKPFECTITPRSEAAIALIKTAVAATAI